MLRHAGREDPYIRVGSSSRLASRELLAAGGMLRVESLPVSASGLSDLGKDQPGKA